LKKKITAMKKTSGYAGDMVNSNLPDIVVGININKVYTPAIPKIARM